MVIFKVKSAFLEPHISQHHHFKYTKLHWVFFIQWIFRLEPRQKLSMCGHVVWTGTLLTLRALHINQFIYEILTYMKSKKNVWFWCLWQYQLCTLRSRHWGRVGSTNCLLEKHSWMIKVADKKAYRSDKVLANTTGSSGAKIVHKIESLLSRNVLTLYPLRLGLPREGTVPAWSLRCVLNMLQLETVSELCPLKVKYILFLDGRSENCLG